MFGRYRLLQQIGKGEIGPVYRALDVPLDRVVALKMLRASRAPDEMQVMRFVRGAKAAARLAHPGIVTVHEVGVVDGTHYFTMEFVEGRTFQEVLAGRALTREEAIEILEKIARAVDHAHSCGVLHRNLRPENILIDRQGQPRITDFGLARILGTGTLTEHGMPPPPSPYMSPEQLREAPEDVDNRTDIYSLGAILYQIVVGEPPREVGPSGPDRPTRRVPGLPAGIDTMVLKAMEPDKALRYAAASEFADDLRRYLNGEAVQTRRAPPVARAFRHVRRSRTLAVIATLVALAAAGIAAWKIKGVRDQQLAREKFEEAERILAEGKVTDPVLARLDEAIRLAPTFVDALVRRGELRALLGRIDEAEADLVAAAESGPDGRPLADLRWRQYLLLRGRPLAVAGPSGEAFELLQPESAMARAARGKVPPGLSGESPAVPTLRAPYGLASELVARSPFSAGEIAWVLAQYDAAIARNERTVELFIDRATLHLLLGRRDEARDDLAEAQKQRPDHPGILVRRVWLDLMERRLDDALSAADRLAAADPADARAPALRALARMEKAAALAEAVRDAEEAGRMAPGDPFVLYVAARAKLVARDPEAARRLAEDAVRAIPDFPQALDVLAEAKLEHRDLPGAQEDLSRCLALRENYWRAHQTQGRIRCARGRPDQAIEDFDRALRLNPDAVTALIERGKARIAMNRPDEAVRDFDEAVSRRPEHVEARALRAHARALVKNRMGAEEDIRWVTEKAPQDGAAQLLLAEARVALNDFAEAIEAARQAKKFDPRLAPEADLIIRNAHESLKTMPPEWIGLMEQADAWIEMSLRGVESRENAYREARIRYQKGFEALKRNPKDAAGQDLYLAVCSYNYACSLVVAPDGKLDVDLAVGFLRQSLQKGFRLVLQTCDRNRETHDGIEHMGHDADLDAIRGDPRFRKLVEEFGPKPPPEEY